MTISQFAAAERGLEAGRGEGVRAAISHERVDASGISEVVSAWFDDEGSPSEALDATSVYRFFCQDGTLLYVGVTSRGTERLAQHAGSKQWWSQVATATFEHFATRRAALRAEADAISTEKPLHNVIIPSPPSGQRNVKGLRPPTPPGSTWVGPLDIWDHLDRLGRRHFGLDAKALIRGFESGLVPRTDARLRYVINLLGSVHVSIEEFGE